MSRLYRLDPQAGETFSLAVRDALFQLGEDGRDRRSGGVSAFFTPGGPDLLCPSMDIEHHGDTLEVSFDIDGFAAFVDAAFA